ncbi:MAG: hypothetical protein K8T91_04485 [Planctomycetes bacterium]|nr:hypothetical protein [Planctomycetota bacterium]
MQDLEADIPTLDVAEVPPMDGCAPDVLTIEAELSEVPHLDGDEHAETEDTERECIDARRVASARECMGGRLPNERQAIHAVISGRHSLFDMLPAVLELAAPATIAELHIATLGFSKQNVAALCAMLDAGTIGRLVLICSHYFAGTSTTIHEYATQELATRQDKAVFLSIRNHAKLLLIRLTDGRAITIESSANLRSCKNIEIATVIGSPAVYEFHAGWMAKLIGRAKARQP